MNGNMLMLICLAMMWLFLLLRRKLYHVPFWKTIPLTVCVSGMGLLGTNIMYFIENGIWNGKSFFGAVLFFPVLLIPISFLFKIRLNKLLNYATVPGVGLLAVYKWNCYLEGCCGGKVLRYSDVGVPSYFPSQLVEMAAAIVLAVVLLLVERNIKHRAKIYPLCLIIYGSMRYILNHFRWEHNDFLFGMPAGNFWSVVSISIGIVWLIIGGKIKTVRDEHGSTTVGITDTED